MARRIGFDKETVKHFPVILSCDPAWTGGDETAIWYKQGHYQCLLEKFKLDKRVGDTHMVTYNKLCYWERQLNADAVHIDQAEGTGIYTFAMNADKHHWILIHFGNNPTDEMNPKDSEYENIRAMMYYHQRDALIKGGVLDSRQPEWIEDIKKQFSWTKGTRHKITNKKLAEPKVDIKSRVGKSPDVCDSGVLLYAYRVVDKLPENEMKDFDRVNRLGGGAMKMPDHKEDVYGEL